MTILLLFLILFSQPIFAGEPVSTDTFIRQFEPDNQYSFTGEKKSLEPKQRLPLDGDMHSTKAVLPTVYLSKQWEVASRLNHNPYNPLTMLIPVGIWLYDKRLEITLLTSTGIAGLALVSLLQKKNFWKRTMERFSNLIAITFPSLHGLNVNAEELSQSIAQKQPSPAEMLLLPPFHSSLEAADPFHDSIPAAVKDVYSWSPEWDPLNRPYDFLQCTTFVAMTYNLNGFHLKGKLIGDARDWIHLTDTFHVFEANTSREIPQVLDTMVWTENGANHVGIVTAVAADRTFQVANGNSSQAVHTYKYQINPDGTILITNLAGKSAKEAWVPSHWLRLKKKQLR